MGLLYAQNSSKSINTKHVLYERKTILAKIKRYFLVEISLLHKHNKIQYTLMYPVNGLHQPKRIQYQDH